MLNSFSYHRSTTLDDALATLSSQDNAKLVLGGTDLLVQISEGVFAPECLIDISFIPELGKISLGADSLQIGAAVTHAQLAEWARDKKAFYSLYEASKSVGTPQVRNIATIVGNLCNAVPSADLAAPVLVLDGALHIVSPGAERKVRASDFFTGPKKTVLAKNEIVTKIEIPLKSNSFSRYYKLGPRNSSDLAVVGVGCSLETDGGSGLKGVSIALSAVAPTPILVAGTDKLLQLGLSEKLADECAQYAVKACSPIDDIRASAQYRRDMVAHCTKQAVMGCIKAALEG